MQIKKNNNNNRASHSLDRRWHIEQTWLCDPFAGVVVSLLMLCCSGWIVSIFLFIKIDDRKSRFRIFRLTHTHTQCASTWNRVRFLFFPLRQSVLDFARKVAFWWIAFVVFLVGEEDLQAIKEKRGYQIGLNQGKIINFSYAYDTHLTPLSSINLHSSHTFRPYTATIIGVFTMCFSHTTYSVCEWIKEIKQFQFVPFSKRTTFGTTVMGLSSINNE